MKRALWLTSAVLLLSAPLTAQTIDAGPFSVDVAQELTVRVNGRAVITADRCVSFRGLEPGEPSFVDIPGGRIIREGNIITLVATKDRNTLRREVMVTPEAVHITFEMRVFGATGGSHLQYDLACPTEYLDGTEYVAWTGAPRGPLGHETGTFSIDGADRGTYLIRSARMVNIGPEDARCSLDFNPGGPWVGETNYGHSYSTSPYHDGTRFLFPMLCSGGRNGGIFTGKITIRPGAPEYESIHSTADVAYTDQYPTARALNFTEGDDAGGFAACDGSSPLWRDPDVVAITDRGGGGLLYRDFAAAEDGQSDATLDLEERSGHYLLTINIRDPEAGTGPFTIGGPDGALFEDVTIPRGEHWVRTAHLRVRDGAAALRFSGDWKIGALTLQPILYETEDFVLDGPFWNMGADGG